MSTPREITGWQMIQDLLTHADRHRELQELALTLLNEYSLDMRSAGLADEYGSVANDDMRITWLAEETNNCLTFSWEESWNDGSREYGDITVPFDWITGRAEWIEAEKVRQFVEEIERQTKLTQIRHSERDARIATLQAEIDSLRALQGPQ